MFIQRRHALRLIAACILFPVLGACAMLHGLRESPQVALADIQLAKAGLMESEFLLHLRVTNPNDVAFEVSALSCVLKLDGRPFARGLASSRTRVGPYDSALVPVSVYASVTDMAGALARLMRTGVRGAAPARYELEGTVLLDVHGSRLKRPFVSRGQLSLDRLGERM